MFTVFFFSLNIIQGLFVNWSIISLQSCISCWGTMKWILYMSTYIPPLGPPSHLPTPIALIWVITEHKSEPPVLYRRFPSVILTVVYAGLSQSPNLSHLPFPPPAVSTYPFSISATLSLPSKYVHLYHFSRFHTYALICNLFFSFWFNSLWLADSRSNYISSNGQISFLFMAE